MKTSKNYCFCTLALGKPYRNLAKQIAEDLKKYSVGTYLIVLTDNPQDFRDFENVRASRHIQESPLFPFNDKRKVLAKALQDFTTAIFVDADSRIVDYFPEQLDFPPGIVVDRDTERSFAESMKMYCSENDGRIVEKFLKKMNVEIDLNQTPFPMQSIFVVTRKSGEEKDFLRYWDLCATYLEISRFQNVSDGYTLGLALALAKWLPYPTKDFPIIRTHIEHLGFKHNIKPHKKWQRQKLRLMYWYRLGKLYLKALKNYEFFFS